MKRLLILLSCILALATPAPLLAQSERFELGQRLRAFEAAWEEQADAAARARAVPHLKRAVTTFFALNPGAAGQALDQARFALRSKDAPPAAVLWAEALFLHPECRFVATDDDATATLGVFYKVDADTPGEAKLRLSLRDAAGKELIAPTEKAIGALPRQVQLRLKGVAAGDHVLRSEIVVADKVIVARDQVLSCVTKRDDRLERLKQIVDAWPREPTSTDRETARRLVALLDALAKKQSMETNYPAARLLSEMEAALKADAAGQKFYGQKQPGQFWLTLALERTKAPARLLAPAAAKKGEALPLVIALHGAGGSENVFFDGYGRGGIVRMCEQRGWLLVTPRAGGTGGFAPLPDIIAAVDHLYLVDKKRVLVVGHSMGAMTAVNSAGQTPDKFAAVAALGGGGAIKASEALKAVPFFVGVGTEDFALTWARSLNDKLQKAEVKTLKFKEYEGIEHLAIVQVALPDVFRFFDDALNK